MERSLRDESFRRDPDTRLHGCNLLDQSMTYISSTCAENIDCIFKETNKFLDSVQSDSDVQELSKSTNVVYDDFYYQIGDKKELNQNLLRDIILTILPVRNT